MGKGAFNLRARVLAGEQVIGTWLFHNNPVWVEIATGLRLDVILVDMEHGQVELGHIPGLLRAASGGETAIVVRTQSDDPKVLSRLLDMGVHGLVVPKVESASAAKNIADACRYPNVGTRGLALGAIRASGYGSNTSYRTQADDSILVAVQIESQAGIDAVDAIAAVSGIDLLFVGPNDLTADLGFADHCDESAERVTKLIGSIHDLGVPTGTIPYHTTGMAELRKMDVNMIIAGSDVSAQVAAIKALVDG